MRIIFIVCQIFHSLGRLYFLLIIFEVSGEKEPICQWRRRGRREVIHIGAVGQDGAWAVETLMEYGVDTRYIAQGSITGHANVFLGRRQSAIVLNAGANHELLKIKSRRRFHYRPRVTFSFAKRNKYAN